MKKFRYVQFQGDISTKVNYKQDVFSQTALTNLVSFTCYQAAWSSGNEVINIDVYTEIARCALHVAETGRRFNVVAGITDVAPLLLYHWKSAMANQILLRNQKQPLISVLHSRRCLLTSNHIFWSYTHGLVVIQPLQSIRKGRTSLTKKFETSQHRRSLMDVLSDMNAVQAEVGDAIKHLFLYIYRGNQTLSKLQYVYLCYLTLWMPMMYWNTN